MISNFGSNNLQRNNQVDYFLSRFILAIKWFIEIEEKLDTHFINIFDLYILFKFQSSVTKFIFGEKCRIIASCLKLKLK